MKTQITTIAAAIALVSAFSASADPRDYQDSTTTPNANTTTEPVFDAQLDIRSGLNGFDRDQTRTSLIVQAGNDNAAETTQGGSQQYSRVGQVGDDNTSSVYQTGAQHESIVYQIGTGNDASVTQLRGELNDSYISQEGHNNSAKVLQVKNSNFSDSIIEQTGDGNSADVYQAFSTDETWSLVSQNGYDNEANVIQLNADLSASYIYQEDDGHVATVGQYGMENVSTIRQNASAASATHLQYGNGNSAISTQW
ncbi:MULTISPECIES: hypothetical protein [unclassified Halomonas]|uniref:hypothetical protein n=1 Tax=unclassified Halomonas TaxID=2609666 RepID=UPI00055939B5|nr:MULTISPECIES: hypothetical protein [unclassified Halomonas]CEP38223.1 Curlin associated [Halomonas sp. R57-5]